MFAPQTLRLRVPQQLENKQMFIYFRKFRVELTLPYPLFPVYRFFCAASCTGLRSLGCLIHASRVGQ
ncbi:hypothetical protein [Synechocystis sp. PCC 7509]|uniref:hypothetical protein n=1 Tax=Synechocystis sp. PCC 7509 TaxID=927677 RepID=UPI0011DDB676|nr:hypothetical protein [Synechocystis sp. PCC 7509]